MSELWQPVMLDRLTRIADALDALVALQSRNRRACRVCGLIDCAGHPTQLPITGPDPAQPIVPIRDYAPAYGVAVAHQEISKAAVMAQRRSDRYAAALEVYAKP